MRIRKSFPGSAAVVAALLATSLAFNAHADVIYSNAITGTNPNAANPYTAGQAVVANLAGSGIGRGAGAVGTNASDRYNANSWNTAGIDLTAYFDWTLTPSSGFAIDFTSITGNWQRSGTGPTSYVLRSSLDGFTANLGSGAISGSSSAVAYNLNLSAATFNAVSAPITLRLYAWGASGSGGTFSVNDFAFNGVVIAAVPEVGAGALIALAGLAMVSGQWLRARIATRSVRKAPIVA